MRFGDLRLQRHDVRGVLVGFRPSDQSQHVGHVFLVALLLGLVVVAEVELPVGEAEAGLREVERVLVRILRVVRDVRAEERPAEGRLGLPHQGSDVIAGLCLLDRVEARLDRLRVELLGGPFVEERAVDRGDFRLVRAGLEALVARPPFEKGALAGLGEIAQDHERAVTRLVRRDLRRRGPLAVGVAEEVVARLDRTVHSGQVDAPRTIPLGRGRRRRRRPVRGAGSGSEQSQ